MTVAHKDLTGTDLHEVKGASTATAGQVPVADGAGTAPFGKLTHTSLQTTGNPFGAQLLHLREEQATGVASTTGIAATWQAVAFNVAKTSEISGAVLAANTITLPAGTYHFRASAPGHLYTTSGQTSLMKLRLRNTSAGTTLLVSQPVYWFNNNAGAGQITYVAVAALEGRFTLAGATNLQLQIYFTNSASTVPGTGMGEGEAYGELLVWRIA